MEKLNYSVKGEGAPEDTDKASDALRKAMSNLNARLGKWLTLSDGDPWFSAQRTRGYLLNTSFRWCIQDTRLKDELTRYSESVWGIATDPQTLSENTPLAGQRLPGMPRRKPRAPEEGEED